MPKASKVTYDRVAIAARSLRQSHQRPTIKTIQEALGGGSTDLVSKYLKLWNAQEGGPLRTEDTSRQHSANTLAPIVDQLERSESLITKLSKLAEGLKIDLESLTQRVAALESKLGDLPADEPSGKRNLLAEAQHLRNQGASAKAVAARIGMSTRWVQLHTYSPRRWTEVKDSNRWHATNADMEELARRMRKEGASIAEISRATGRSWGWAKDRSKNVG